jgi:hypothetical protein
MSLDGTMTQRLRDLNGQVHAFDGKNTACGWLRSGGHVFRGDRPLSCEKCIEVLNARALKSLRSFVAAARKHGFMP